MFQVARHIEAKWDTARNCEAHVRSFAERNGVRWIRVLLRLMFEAALQRLSPPPDSLYHYCSVDPFVGIVRTGQI